MKPPRLVATLAFLLITRLATTGACCATTPADRPGVRPAPAAPASDAQTASPVGHPLRGVIVAVLREKSALLVKHEEIPGVMAAMTMLLKVDDPTLDAAQKGQAITATLVKKADGWWLQDVKTTDSVK